MIKRLYIILFLFLVAKVSHTQESNIVVGEVLVLLEKNYNINSLVKELNISNPEYNVKVKKTIAKRINVWLISFNSKAISNKDFLNKVYQNKSVQIAQNNHSNISLRDTCPNDTYFASNQWSLNNTSQFGGTVGVDIDACKAWDLAIPDSIPDTTYYGDEIVVAVVDEGFDMNHEDINYYVNPLEIPGDGIDNDGNGYIDDVNGWNVYANNGNITSALHGTHLSGIIGAKGNNNQGISGISPGTTILAVQGSSNLESDVLASYGYVLEMRDRYDSTNGAEGAFVVATNNSFGIDYASAASYPLWCAFYDSLGSRGILNCAATANSNINVDVDGDMPTTCVSDFVIAVNNTTGTDSKYPSGYGAINIDLGAPGVSIYSTTPGNNYGVSTGTSQATPHVTGSIAFIFSIACSNFMDNYYTNPASTALLIKDAILNKTDPNPNLAGITTSGGRLNLYNAAYEIKTYGLCSLTDVNEQNNQSVDFKLFPNPNNGKFNLQITNSTEKYQVVIYNSIGAEVYNKPYENNTLIEADLNKGLYFLCLKSYNTKTKTVKFVVE